MTVLIEVDELAEALVSDQPPVLADVRWELGQDTGRADFEAEHIPGAQWVDLPQELSSAPGEGGRHPLPTPEVFERAMRRIGVSDSRPVVVCDAANALAASRLWWLLTDAGHDDVRVLNGGVAAWAASGRAVATGPEEIVPQGSFSARPGSQAVVDGAELLDMINNGAAPLLVDVRAAERYAGETEPIDPVAGHIPGAVNAPSTQNSQPDGRFLPADALARRFADLGVDQDTVFYCGSGITAAQTLLAVRIAGLSGGRIYPGSWSDWIRDPARPVGSGPTP